jgi:O-antigen/teichoic acid export membrane protein
VLAVAVLLLFCHPLQAHFFVGVDETILVLAICSIPLEFLVKFFSFVFLAVDDVTRYNVLYIALPIAFLALMFPAMTAFHDKVMGTMAAKVASSVLLAIWLLCWAIRSAGMGLKPSWRLWKASFSYGPQVHLGNMASFVSTRLDLFIISYFASLEQVGYYSLAVGIAELLFFFPNTVGLAFFPRVSSLNDQDAQQFSSLVCRNVIFLSAILALLVLALGKPGIRLVYGQAFLPAVGPLTILLPGAVAKSVTKILGPHFNSRGKPLVSAAVATITLVANVALDFALIPTFGMNGAAWARTIPYTFGALVMLVLFGVYYGADFAQVVFVRRDDIKLYRLKLAGLFTKQA